MGRSRFLLLVFSLSSLLIWFFLPAARAQNGGLTVSTDYELFGISPLSGGGHVTWTLRGDAAKDLRAKIVHLFDEYPRIPRGFRYAGEPTNGNGDGTIQALEGVRYTDLLELELEGWKNSLGGTQVGYFLLDRADLLEKSDTDPSAGFRRSTSGIEGTDATSTTDLQIRFLFNGDTSADDVDVLLPTRAYSDALMNVFTLDAVQSPSLTSTGGYPGSWPFLAEGGWRIKPYDATHPALWAGNETSCVFGNESLCRYDNGRNAVMPTSLDPVVYPEDPGFDLRFASSAWVTFNYTGQVADEGDYLRLEIAPGPPYTSWASLSGGNLSIAQNTLRDEWRMVSVDLSAYLGQKVQLRARFASDASGTAPGFFLRDFAVHAPSRYEGSLVQSDAHYLIGTLSFSDPRLALGGLTLLRTPGGEILLYRSTWDTGVFPGDFVRFQTFNAVENPQFLFAVMVVASYVIATAQERAYDRYREAHPSVFRPAVHKAGWLHWLGRASVLLLVLFYFVPTAFFLIGLPAFIGGAAYLFLALSLALGLGLGTRAYYQQRLEVAPPPAVPEGGGPTEPAPGVPVPEAPKGPVLVAHCTHCLRPIPEGEKTYRCSCGAMYHLTCASGLMRCTTCRKPIALETVKGRRAVSMRCASCGEVQVVPEGVDPRTVACASCGGQLRSLEAGRRYLLISSNPGIAFQWTRDLAKGGKPVLCVTAATPERLQLEYGLPGVGFLHVSAEDPRGVDPKRLDPAGLKAILPLAREGKGGVLLYDGLEQIVASSSTGDVIRFLRKANDMAFVHGVTVIGRVAPGLLAESEIERLAAEFDEVLDLSARL